MCLTLGQVVAAQFPTKLANYAEQLDTQKNGFQVAMVMQIARDVDMMSMWYFFLRVRFVECRIESVHDVG